MNAVNACWTTPHARAIARRAHRGALAEFLQRRAQGHGRYAYGYILVKYSADVTEFRYRLARAKSRGMA